MASENLATLLPKVVRKGSQNQEIIEPFNPQRIYESLLEETSATPSEAEAITLEVVRLLMRLNLPRLTGPMIRELACAVLLQLGFEKFRYQYTRVGFPMRELGILIEKTPLAQLPQVALDHLLFEFRAVKAKTESFGNAPQNKS